MRILLVKPYTPDSFYSFRKALSFISKKAAEPPLGLLTVAALIPEKHKLKLIDMDVEKLSDRDIRWADYVFLTGMDIQKESFERVIRRCNQQGTSVVAGGPYATLNYESILGVDHFLIGEAEVTCSQLIADLEAGIGKRFYFTESFPDLCLSPIPKWELVNMKKYATVVIQYSRGCPYNCEFCSIPVLNGLKHRRKTTENLLAELDKIYELGWRGDVFIVDDNFVANHKVLINDLLPGLKNWLKERNYPFSFSSQVSIDIADDDTLIKMMREANFIHVFIGIETPNEESLKECQKKQNRNRNVLNDIEKLHRMGLRVSAGFIIGFDSDDENIFANQIEFIRKSKIATAMVGLLGAPKGSRLRKRLKSENRLLGDSDGNNVGGNLNFIPRMDYKLLVKQYKHVLESIYSSKNYYRRVREFIDEFQPLGNLKIRISPTLIRGAFMSVWKLGILDKGKGEFWKLIGHTLRKHPQKIAIALTLAVYGYHFRYIVDNI